MDAQFTPPLEKLAFALQKGEFDLPDIYEKPLDVIIQTLEKYQTYEEMINHFPDIPKDTLS